MYTYSESHNQHYSECSGRRYVGDMVVVAVVVVVVVVVGGGGGGEAGVP